MLILPVVTIQEACVRVRGRSEGGPGGMKGGREGGRERETVIEGYKKGKGRTGGETQKRI